MSRRPSIVDLTSTSSRPQLPFPRSSASAATSGPSVPSRLPLRSSREPRGVKRRRDSADTSENEPGEEIEAIDLTEVDDSSALAKALSKQREDAVKAQQATQSEDGRSALTAYKCPVCMDTPTDATSTSCGHLFCHKCIIDTLKFSEEQRRETGKSRGMCPVCRKELSRLPGHRRGLFPLQLKLKTRDRTTARVTAS